MSEIQSPWHKKLAETRKKLDQFSPSLCMAKWLQVTIHLQNGHNHSCHHNPTHRIDLVDVEKETSAMHNTSQKLLERKSMLEGERPTGCFYCWRVEDSTTDAFSDRLIKSSDSWAHDRIEEIGKSSWTAPVPPSYLEVSFSNLCNFACAYCKPEISSKIFRELKDKGPFPVKDRDTIEELERLRKLPYKGEEDNPYIQSFWKWFESISDQLKVFRLTGGEPLIHKNTFKMFEYLVDKPNPDLEFSINSNFGVDHQRFKMFLVEGKKLLDSHAIKKLLTYTSVDTHGKQAEYGRDGLSYEDLKSYCDEYLRYCAEFELTIMVTYNVFSVPRFKNFLQDILDLRKALVKDCIIDECPERFLIDISTLHSPEHLNILILPKSYEKFMMDSLSFMQENRTENIGPAGFHEYEINKLQRLIEWFQKGQFPEERLSQIRGDFSRFVDEFDQRRNKNFLTTFPEYEEFYHYCSGAGQIPNDPEHRTH